MHAAAAWSYVSCVSWFVKHAEHVAPCDDASKKRNVLHDVPPCTVLHSDSLTELPLHAPHAAEKLDKRDAGHAKAAGVGGGGAGVGAPPLLVMHAAAAWSKVSCVSWFVKHAEHVAPCDDASKKRNVLHDVPPCTVLHSDSLTELPLHAPHAVVKPDRSEDGHAREGGGVGAPLLLEMHAAAI
jgi:hypothetical protein